MNTVIVAILSYLLGTVSGSFIIGKYSKGIDIRKFGSGNAGTTNAIRVLGKKLGVITFIVDFFKGIITILLVKYFFGQDYLLLSALFCVIGHDYPFYMNFKGGKGIATTIGTFAVIDFKFTLIAVILGITVAAISRYVSLGSISFLIFLSIFSTIFIDYNLYSLLIIYVISIIGILRHKSNINRILKGEESKIGGK